MAMVVERDRSADMATRAQGSVDDWEEREMTTEVHDVPDRVLGQVSTMEERRLGTRG